MCDYSLHAVASRPAEVAETLISSIFQSTTTRGFASPNDPQVAVCLSPGTEIAFDKEVQVDGLLAQTQIADRLARFRQVYLTHPTHHHDALEFSNGAIVLVTDLLPGQRATVLQLPANAVDQVVEARSASRHEIVEVV